MESSYGVGVRNRYDLLNDEDGDPNEVIELNLKEQEEKQKKKKEQEFTKNKTLPKKKGKENQEKIDVEKPQRPKRTDDLASKRGRSDRTVRFANSPRVNREERNNYRDEIDDKPSFETAPPREMAPRLEGNERGRGRGIRVGRGRGRGRGRGFGQDGFDSRGKREFDRSSGSEKSSSVRSFEKREGGGAHNWGRPTEMDASDESWGDVEVAPPEELIHERREDLSHLNSGLEDKYSKDPHDESKDEIPIQVDNSITFEEYKRQQGDRQKPTFNIRKAGEGEEHGKWKKGFSVLAKKEGESESEYEDDDEDCTPHGRQKQVVNINIEFSNPRTPRGRGRGRGRGGSRRDDSKQSAPKVDDEKDFPSLL